MSQKQKSVDNHYIPRMYLKNWSTDGVTVWMYRRLVSHKNVERWKQQAIDGTAYLPHLYSHVDKGNITGDFENWLNYEVENPAKLAIEKVLSERNLKAEEWTNLLRFTAAQLVRTPAHFIKHHENWVCQLDKVMAVTMKDVQDKVLKKIRSGEPIPKIQHRPLDELMPLKISRIEPTADDDTTYMKAETTVGRAMWLSYIRHMVKDNLHYLQSHKWHIIKAANGIEWPTSDDPVICLNFRSETDYSFNGGIIQKNAEIMLPLSPQHLLYTRVGSTSFPYEFLAMRKT